MVDAVFYKKTSRTMESSGMIGEVIAKMDVKSNQVYIEFTALVILAID